ncbi:MAG: HIT family protein [Acidobacteria bacterium]|nr:MAG: HIT family protein [Acidobacteriota bacterium]
MALNENRDECPFCDRIGDGDFIAESDVAVAFADKFPVSRGHALVVPRHHAASLFEISQAEIEDVWGLVSHVRSILQGDLAPDGFNIGLNDGEAAGQTVGHAHVHVIPRYKGDVPDPRGGVRWVFPDKAAYWLNK